MQTTVTLKASASEAAVGWHCRLHDLGKGYKVSERPAPFGRTCVLVKRDGGGVELFQGRSNAVQALLKQASAAQLEILEDLHE